MNTKGFDGQLAVESFAGDNVTSQSRVLIIILINAVYGPLIKLIPTLNIKLIPTL